MSGFKLTGDYYVSEWNGNSGNPGTALSPFSHPVDAPSSTVNVIVVGAGHYKGTWAGTRVLTADGKVILDCQGASLTGTNGIAVVRFKNLEILACNGLNQGQSNIEDCYVQINSSNVSHGYFTRCIIAPYLSNPSFTGQYCLYRNCIFLSDFTAFAYGSENSRFILDNCYIPKEVTVILAGTLFNNGLNLFQIFNCLINGTIVYNGNQYECKTYFDGSPRLDANPSKLDIYDIVDGFESAQRFVNSVHAGDPKIVDVKNKIVELDSDLLKKSNSWGFIGGVKAGQKIAVNSSDPNIIITTTNIDTTADPANWRIASGFTEGEIDIVWKGSDNITEIQEIFMDSVLSFLGSETGGSLENNNVPDIWPTSYTPTTNPDMTPNRLTYALRTSQSIAMPTLNSQWDNDSATLGTTPGDFYIQEWNTKPTISDVLGTKYGNGQEAGLGGTVNSINARWRNAKIRLTNNRSY